MKSTSIIICLALIAIVGGCVTDYKPHLDGNEENLLVVDAIISDGETVVTLQMSSDIYVAEEENNEGDNVTENAEENPSSGADFVRGATVWVESEGGERFDAADENTGRYVARTGELDPETGYRLRISLNGEEYASEYRKPQQTPPIDEVDFSLNGREIDVRIDVKGAADASKHYMWRYKEAWEVTAGLYSTHYYGVEGRVNNYYTLSQHRSEPLSIVMLSYRETRADSLPYSPYYYCWKYSDSKGLILGSTDILTENTIVDKVMYRIDRGDDRLSNLYRTKVIQYALGDDAYTYFDNIDKNTEEAGSIFGPIPSDMRGNIVCTTSPATRVIGFVEVSSPHEYEAYLSREQSHYLAPATTCVTVDMGEAMASPYSFYLVSYATYGFEEHYRLTSTPDCLDCRKNGGSKLRPGWWPNNHI